MIRARWSIHVAQEIPNKLHNFLVCLKKRMGKSIKQSSQSKVIGPLQKVVKWTWWRKELFCFFFKRKREAGTGFIIAMYHVIINENFGKQIWGMKRTYVQLWKGLQITCIVYTLIVQSLYNWNLPPSHDTYNAAYSVQRFPSFLCCCIWPISRF